MEKMFYGASSYNREMDQWNVERVTTMTEMFMFADKFDRNLTAWDVSSVKTLDSMFSHATKFNKDLSSWSDHLGNLTSATRMFQRATSFHQRLCWGKHKFDITRPVNVNT